MRRLLPGISVFLVFFSGHYLFAYLSPKDSLERLLPNSKGVEKAEVLLQLADLYIASDLNKSFGYSKQAIELSNQLNNITFQCKSYRMLGVCYSDKGDHDSSKYFLELAIKHVPDDPLAYFFLGQNEWFNGNDIISNQYYQKAEKYAIKKKDLKTLAITYSGFAEYYRYHQQDSLSEYYIELSIQILEKSSFLGDLAMAYNIKAELLRKKGEYPQALEMYNKTARIAYKTLDSNRIGYCFSRMGYIYYMQNQFEIAENYLLKALSISQTVNSKFLESFTLGAITDLYSNMGNVVKCRKYAQLCIDHAYQIKDYSRISLAYSSLSNLYYHTGDLDSAMVYANMSYNLAKENEDILNILNAILNKTTIEFARGNFSTVISVSDEGIKLANITQTMEHLKDLYMYRYKSFEKLGNKSASFEAFSQFKMYEDSLQNNNVKLSVKQSQLEMSYQDKHLADTLVYIDNAQKATQKILLEKQRSRFFVIIGILVAILLSAIIFIVLSTSIKRKKLNQELTESNHDKELLLKEIHHRVKNSLQITSSLLSLQKNQSSNKSFEELIDESQIKINNIAIVHELLYQSSSFKKINLEQYVDKLTNHILQTYHSEIKNIRINSAIENVEIGLDKSVPLALVINEIITNSVKYAFKDKSEGLINIKAHKKDGRIYVEIHDNGVGIDLEKEKNGIGMTLIQGFVKQLKGSIEVGNNNGCFFVISFPEN